MIILIFKIILATTNFIIMLFANEQKTDLKEVQNAWKDPILKIELLGYPIDKSVDFINTKVILYPKKTVILLHKSN
jgi:hypothetical protein